MLVSPHTLLARRKRQKLPLWCLAVYSVEMMHAVLEAAKQTESPALLIIPVETSISLDSFIHFALTEAARHPQQIALVVQTDSTDSQVQQALAANAPALWIKFLGNDSFDYIRKQSEKIGATTKIQARNVIVELGRTMTYSRVETLAREVDMQALALPSQRASKLQYGLSLAQLREITTVSRLPLILSVKTLSRFWMSKAMQAGVVGLKLEHELEEAYLAGVSVGVKESPDRYARFTRYSEKAVQKTAESYFNLFK